MKTTYTNMKSSNNKGSNLITTWFEPENTVKAVVVISHGIGEHMGRYAELAEFLSERGIAVVGLDMIGHGRSISKSEPAMYFGKEGSWKYLVFDLINLVKIVKEKYPNKPCFLLGFSMGSFVVRHALIEAEYRSIEINGVILAGTGKISNLTAELVKNVISKESEKVGGDFNQSSKVNDLAFGNYNKHFKPCKTQFDWLCQNEEGIKGYIDDNLTKKFITPGMFRELLSGMAYTSQKNNIKKVDPNIPMLFLSGANDPVCGFRKGIMRIVKVFGKHFNNVELKIYTESRHDIFHDNSKQKATNCLHNWICLNI